MLPPGGKATTKVIGPVGNSCPKPRLPSAKRPASAAAIRTARRATIVRFLPMPGRVYAQSVGAQVVASNRISFCGALGGYFVVRPCRGVALSVGLVIARALLGSFLYSCWVPPALRASVAGVSAKSARVAPIMIIIMVLIMVSSWAFCGGRFQPVAHCDGSFSPENRCPQGPLRGQKRKSSERANVFRFTPESGQTADASGCHDRTHALQQQNSVVGSSRPRRQASHSRNGRLWNIR